ncbi:calcium-binding protein [Mesorhizobium sp. ES1-1]|uniref:calcium-binding protein n=1 Tax=Mesorhizobium sp. ES1-1 TaxID=2876629 RepID=UPI001CCEEED7|nr:calcium-binding protein [Mesorhizobium sp. ES1-1]MBZ9678258.1 hypothetical protein [Mesorhizobium sp. ES1-1]
MGQDNKSNKGSLFDGAEKGSVALAGSLSGQDAGIAAAAGFAKTAEQAKGAIEAGKVLGPMGIAAGAVYGGVAGYKENGITGAVAGAGKETAAGIAGWAAAEYTAGAIASIPGVGEEPIGLAVAGVAGAFVGFGTTVFGPIAVESLPDTNLDPTGNAQRYLDNLPMMTGIDRPDPGVPSQSQNPFTPENNSLGPLSPVSEPQPGTNSAPSAGLNPNAFTSNNNSFGPFSPVGEQRPGTMSAPSGAADARAADKNSSPNGGTFNTSGATQSGNPSGHNVGYNAGYGDDYSGAENNGTGSSYGVSKPTHYSPDPNFLGGVQLQGPSYVQSQVVDLTAPAQIYSPTTPQPAIAAVDPNYGLVTVGLAQVYIGPQVYYDVTTKPAAVVPHPVPTPPRARVAPIPAIVPALVYVPGVGYTNKPDPIDAVGAAVQNALDAGLSPAAATAIGMTVAQQRHVSPDDPNLHMRIANLTGATGGKSDHASNSSPGGLGNSVNGVSAVGDHAGHPNGVSGNPGNGWGGHPVLLDLAGNGLSINELSSSSQFLDLEGDGYQHRTAWAGNGNGVLVLDADGDGKISRSSEFVFTEWDQSATSDLEALKSVFDTNHNGLLDAGDDRWSDFKIMVDGQLVSLASLGIASIDLTATGSGQNFADSSAITGTTTYMKTDGTTGAVGDALLASDANGYIIKSAFVTNGDGSKTTTLGGYNKDGTLAFQNRITVSADGLSTTTQFDDDGNGTYERSQTDVTTITAGVRQRTVSDFNTDGSLAERTTTTTSADKKTVTTALDQEGDGAPDQTQAFVRNVDGSTVTTVSENSVNGTLLRKVVTAASADGLSKTVQRDTTGTGVYDLTSTETTVVAGDGTRTKTAADTSSGGTLIDRELTVSSADGRTRTVLHDRDGDGTYEIRDATIITSGAGNSTVTTVSTYSSTNVLIAKTVATTSSDGLSKTVSTDSNGDGQADLVSSDVTVVGAGGSLTETQQLKSRDGTLLSSTITSTSGDLKTISISADANGDGHVDMAKTIVVDGAGVTTSTVSQFNADGSLVGRTYDQTSADGLSLTSKVDIDGDGIYDSVVTDVTTTDASSNRTRTVTTKSANSTLIGSSAITTTADSLTQTERDDIDGDGIVDRTIVTATVLGGDGSRTVTSTTTSTSGVLLAKTELKTSADRKTTTTKVDANGDTKIDQTVVNVVNADGSEVSTVSDTDINGVLHGKTETSISSDGLTNTVKQDVNGDGVYDSTTQAVTTIAASGARTTTTSTTSSNGTLLARTIAAVSANGLSVNIQADADGNSVFESKSSDVTVLNADGSKTRTVSALSGSGVLIAKTLTFSSADGHMVTTSTDVDGDGLFELVSSDVKLLGSNGSTSETLQLKSRDGSLLSSSTTNISADQKTTSNSTDADGDGHVDTVKTIVVDNAGVTTSTVNRYTPNGTLVGKTFDQISANALSLTSKADIDGDGTYDTTVAEVTTIDASGNKTRTVTNRSANGTLVGSSVVTTSANGLTQTKKDDINADGTVDRTTVTATTLAADGSKTSTSTTTSTSGAVLAKTEMTTSADQKTVTTKIDANGDNKTDRTQVDILNADGSVTTTVSDTDINGVQHGKSETTHSADGLTATVKQDMNGDGVYDTITQGVTAIAASGAHTTTTSTTSNNGSLLSKKIATISGNGLSTDVQVDSDGDGIVEDESSDVTVLNADGSTTRTVSALAGTGALIGKTIKTTSANGLVRTVQSDLDGNGTIDRTSTSTTTLGADGSKSETAIVKNASNAQIARYETITSGDGNTVTSTRDLDGDGMVDETTSSVLNMNGSTTTVIRTYAVGVLTSSATKTVSANGLSSTLAADLDGNSSIDQSTTSVIVLNADGSKTETITDLDAAGIVKDKTTVVTSANGLVKTTTWAAVGATTSRSKVDTTALNADGSTSETVDYKKANGSLESRTVTTVSANKLTTVVTKDVNGDGAVDVTTTTVQASDGSTTATTIGPDTTGNAAGTGAYTTSPSTTSKITTISADGLSSTTQYGATSVDYLPDLPSKRTTETTIGADGSTVQTIKAYESPLVLTEQTRTTTAGNGLGITKEWDLDGNGTYDRKETDVTVWNADGSHVQTVNKFEGATQTSSFVTTTSANGLSVTTSLDLFGANPFSQDSTDITNLGSDGSKTRTVTYFKADGSQLSKFVTATTGDGRTVTIQEDTDGVVGTDRVISDTTRVLADGSMVETVNRSTPSGTLLDSTVKTTSGDGRLISITRDADGDGSIDQTEVTTKRVDGTTSVTITDFNGANHKSSTTQISTSGDGLLTTTYWDFDADGTVDQTRRINVAKLGDGITDTKTRDGTGASDTFYNKTTTYTSDDGRSSWTAIDYDASGGGFDNTISTITQADGSTIHGIHNRNQDVAHLIPGTIYWKNVVPGNVVAKTSADGLTTSYWYDYDSNATNPVSVENPSTSAYEVTAVAHVQIDGSIVTEIVGHDTSTGPITAKGIMTVSADGSTTTLLKDGDNNGTYEHKEVAFTRIDGSIQKIVTEYNTSGAVTQTVTTDVSADGQSTSVITANTATGSGTSTGLGVEFYSPGTTNDTITGSAGDDTINGGAGNDTINAGAGDDLLNGGTGADTLKGNAGNDTFVVDNVGDIVGESANEGIDTVLSSVTYTITDGDVENLTLTGTGAINGNGNDSTNTLTGNDSNNVMRAFSGDDTLYGMGGDDSLTGDFGNDTLYGGAGNDYLNGQLDNDTYVYRHGDGSDTIEDFVTATTTASSDISAAQALGVKAGGTVNTWVGGYYWQTSSNSLLKLTNAGTDTLKLTGGIVADNLTFAWTGVGNDNLVINIAGGAAGDSVTIDQQAIAAAKIDKLELDSTGAMAFAVVRTAGGTLTGTSLTSEILFGLGGNETINGNGGDDIFYGGAGNDVLNGSNTFLGLGGNDTFYGGTGNDYLNGAGGNDRYVFHRGDGTDYITDFNIQSTTQSSDISAAQAKGVSATGIVNTWVGGYYWNTTTNGLQKATDGNVDTLALESGIKAEDLSFAWTGAGNDNLVMTIGGGPAGDAVVLNQQTTSAAKIENLTLDGVGTMNLVVASASGATATAGTGSSIIFGLAGNETLNGNTGNDILYGGAGNDVISGFAGNDTLVGQVGNDYLAGAVGNDLYIYNLGDGADSVEDIDAVVTTASADITAANALGVNASGIVNTWVGGYNWNTSTSKLMKAQDGGVDTIKLGPAIGVDDLAFSWSGENLLMTIGNPANGNSINLKQQSIAAGRIEKLQLDGAGPINLAVAASAGSTVSGSTDADLIFGLGGNETLNGNAGNDILVGGLGNDTLVGGAGNDQYRFKAGDGADTIVESGTYTDNDELDFGAGIDANELWFSQQGNNLVVSVLGTTDKVTVTDWFAGPGNVVETIKSGDGKVLHSSDVATMVAAMAAFDPATSPSGTGIQPNDPRLGDPNQVGTIASAMQSSWMAA